MYVISLQFRSSEVFASCSLGLLLDVFSSRGIQIPMWIQKGSYNYIILYVIIIIVALATHYNIILQLV